MTNKKNVQTIINDDITDMTVNLTATLISTNEKTQELNMISISATIKEISWLCFPTMLFFVCLFLQQTINLYFIGQLYSGEEKKNVIDGIGISHLYINCLLLSIAVGLITGFETLGSNAFGAKQYYLLGLYLHRAQMIAYIFTIIVFTIHYFTMIQVIESLGIEAAVMKYVEEYIRTVMFFILFDIQFSLNFRYLNIIGKSWINLVILFITIILHPIWCYLFINVLDFGIRGGAFSIITSQMLNAILGALYIYIINPLPESIFFYNKKSFEGWLDYLKISIPSTFLTCAEWWGFEIQAIIAIWISKTDYTIHILVTNISGNLYCICLGFGIAAVVLVGRSVGEGNIPLMKRYAHVLLLFGMSVMTVATIIYFFMRRYLLSLFIDNQELIDKGADVMAIITVMNIFDLIQTIFCCICRGLRKQLAASLVVFINLYVLNTVLSIVLGKFLQMGVIGIWTAITIGCVTCSIVYFFILMRFDYEKIKIEILEIISKDAYVNSNEEKIIE